MSTLPVINPADVLPLPLAIDTSTQEDLRAAWVAKFTALFPGYTVAMLRSDPGAINAEALSFLRLDDRYHLNDVYRAGRLTLAKGTNLTGLAADIGLARRVYLPATATTAAVEEDDDELLLRCWLTFQRWARGGTNLGMEGAARTLAGADVDDVYVYDFPGKGRMRCNLLPPAGQDAAVTAAMLARVSAGLMRRDTRFGSVPCEAALVEVLPLDLVITLGVLPGASQADAIAASRVAVARYLGGSRMIARRVALSRVEGDACITNVEYAHVAGLSGDLLPTRDQAYGLRSLVVQAERADG